MNSRPSLSAAAFDAASRDAMLEFSNTGGRINGASDVMPGLQAYNTDDVGGSQVNEASAAVPRGRNRRRGGLAIHLSARRNGDTNVDINSTSTATNSSQRCRVCGEIGHSAGFVGAVYMDCPNYACYLCKQHGHTTAGCPFRPQPSNSTKFSDKTVKKAAMHAHWRAGDALSCSGRVYRRKDGTLLPLHALDKASFLRVRQLYQGAALTATAIHNAATQSMHAAMDTKLTSDALARQTTAASAGDDWGKDACALHPYLGRWRVQSGVLKLHSRRTTVLSFHPSPMYSDVIVSCDKSGELGVWRFLDGGGSFALPTTSQRAGSRAVYGAHKWLINALDWGVPGVDSAPGTLYTASSDGTVRMQDVEQGKWVTELIDLNPLGWTGDESLWRMFYSVATGSQSLQSNHSKLVLAGDDAGRIWAFDPRARRAIQGYIQGHRKGAKVQSIHFHPLDGYTFATASNDWTCKIWDLRYLQFKEAPSSWYRVSQHEIESLSSAGGGAITKGGEHCVVQLQHSRVVNNAIFSPHTGSRLLTTCIDNRIRVWDHLATLSNDSKPTTEVVHSHDFARYLSPFRAQWDPKDHGERTVICGRYISEAFDIAEITGKGHTEASGQTSVAAGSRIEKLPLHPIDVVDVGTAPEYCWPGLQESIQSSYPSRVVSQLVDPLMTTISPVVAVHPHLYYVAGGTSKNVFIWGPNRVQMRTTRQPSVHDWVSTRGVDPHCTRMQGSARDVSALVAPKPVPSMPVIYAGPDPGEDGGVVSSAALHRMLGDAGDSDDEPEGRQPRKKKAVARKKKATAVISESLLLSPAGGLVEVVDEALDPGSSSAHTATGAPKSSPAANTLTTTPPNTSRAAPSNSRAPVTKVASACSSAGTVRARSTFAPSDAQATLNSIKRSKPNNERNVFDVSSDSD